MFICTKVFSSIVLRTKAKSSITLPTVEQPGPVVHIHEPTVVLIQAVLQCCKFKRLPSAGEIPVSHSGKSWGGELERAVQ